MSIIVRNLYLEGFAKIHTGMHIDRLYLDFERMPNKTFLFVGNSGSGKSSVLRCIHPFAFNSGAGEESSNNSTIMEGRDGRKIISYRVNGHIVTCNHIYTSKNKQFQVKSYISIDGEEKNPSGLVSTFKEEVSRIFYIDESFLKLLSLGNSVQSIVEHTSSERKKLAVKLFSELNIYMTYYKNASERVKELKSVLNNVIDKLDKCGKYDKDEIKQLISPIESKIKKYQNELNDNLIKQGSLINEQSSISEEVETYKEEEGKTLNLFTQIEALKRKRTNTKSLLVLENERDELKKAFIDIELNVNVLDVNIKSELQFKEDKLKHQKQLEDNLHKMKSSIDKLELEKLLANIDAELSSLEEIELLPDINYKEKKEQLVRANIYLDELRSMCSDFISEVRYQHLIPKMVENYLKDKNFDHKVDVAYNAALERVNNIKAVHNIDANIEIPKIENDCTNKDCPYKKFYETVIEVLTSKKEDSEKLLRDENEKLHTAEEMMIIRKTIKKVYHYVNSHKDILKLVPEDIFNPESFINKFLSNDDREIYNRELLTDSVNYMENASRKEELISLKESTISQLNGINNTKELFDSMVRDLESIKHTLENSEATLDNYRTNLEYNQNKLESVDKELCLVEKEIGYTKELTSLREEIQDIQKKLIKMEPLKNKYNKIETELNKLKESESEKNIELNRCRRDLNTLKQQLETITSLEHEKIQLSEKYSKAILIRDAVSPSKGIPVEFIDDVIRNQMIDSINELMHIAYPDITLLKDSNHLIINDKEFTIGYKKNGEIINDISEASDGERAMLSLAFSLVLIRLASKVYNIMLLDEMDTSLDKYGRTKFIDIIEQYMETINAEQLFLISHNSMFDMYGVNVLQTTNSVSGCNDDTVVTNVYEQNYTPEEYK